jgi:hypothetical protein
MLAYLRTWLLDMRCPLVWLAPSGPRQDKFAAAPWATLPAACDLDPADPGQVTGAEATPPNILADMAASFVMHEITVDCVDVEAVATFWAGERHGDDDGIVLVMADPEGNEFCHVQYT